VSPPLWVLELGRVGYERGSALQRQLAAARDADRVPDLILLLEHPPVITLGRRGSRDDILAGDEELARLGIEVHATNRGGLVTYHGPGQLVCYPIARLRQLAGDAPSYVWGLEEAIIHTLAGLGIAARRDAAHRGVFTDQGKIAAIGVAVTHGVTMHGFALNLQPDLRHFDLINPCGIGQLGVTSVERILGYPVDLVDTGRTGAFHLGGIFGRAVEPAPPGLREDLRAAGFGAVVEPPAVGAPAGG
jgi:lipoate-protein ligase B